VGRVDEKEEAHIKRHDGGRAQTPSMLKLNPLDFKLSTPKKLLDSLDSHYRIFAHSGPTSIGHHCR